MEKESLEKLVADAILERSAETVKIDGREFEITPATPATLILISELVAEMPVMSRKTSNVLQEVLCKARDLRVLGRIIATLILGARRIREGHTIKVEHTEACRRWSWRQFRMIEAGKRVTENVKELDWLSERLLEEVTTNTLLRITAKRIALMQVADFFELTTSLSEANLLKRTKEVEETAFGGSSSVGQKI